MKLRHSQQLAHNEERSDGVLSSYVTKVKHGGGSNVVFSARDRNMLFLEYVAGPQTGIDPTHDLRIVIEVRAFVCAFMRAFMRACVACPLVGLVTSHIAAQIGMGLQLSQR